MKRLVAYLMVVLPGVLNAAADSAPFIVKDGAPNAQIVIAAENRPRMATLAALDLRRYIEKSSGARLPIVTAPDESIPVKIFVGDSPGAARAGVTSEGLEGGAFRMVSGPDWLVLVGQDKDFVPNKMTSMKRDDPGPGEEWRRLTQGKTKGRWPGRGSGSFKDLWAPEDFAKALNDYYGEDAAGLWMTGGNTLNSFWRTDADGSITAVSWFLQSLGVRFYMPIELGEVVPKLATIPLPQINETIIPDFPCRTWLYYNYFKFPLEQTLWDRRLGMNEGGGYYSGVHGLTAVHSTEESKQALPEMYAMIGGKRDTTSRGVGTPCFNSDELFRETVNYCRFRYDVIGSKIVDIMPGDGLRHCECEKCKDSTHSDMVWGFVNRVATELYKTHPDKLVNCGAYSSYRDAPDSIEKFSPNVMVSIYNYGRPAFMDSEVWAEYQGNIEKWRSRLAPGRIRRGENNLHNGSPAPGRRQLISYPIIFPRAMARDLKYLKGVSFGEGAECPQIPGRWKAPGVDHLALYVQARFLMDADQDTDQVLDEYYKLFYGPAAAQMKAAFTYAEDNMATRDKSKSGGRTDITNVPMEAKLRLRDLLDEAKAAAGDGIYGARIAKIIAELKPRESVLGAEDKVALNKQRRKTPLVQGTGSGNVANARQYALMDLRPGKEAVESRTTFQVGWDKNTLLLDIVCKEPDMARLKVSNPVDKGDYVAIALETPIFDGFYRVYIGPDGKLLEGNPMPGSWASLAEVKIEKGPDFWRANVRLPAVDAEEGMADPNHRVAGEKPTIDGLWYFNLARQRVRGDKIETQVLSRTKDAAWDAMESFGKLEIK